MLCFGTISHVIVRMDEVWGTGPSNTQRNETRGKDRNDYNPIGKEGEPIMSNDSETEKVVWFSWHLQRRTGAAFEVKMKAEAICPRDRRQSVDALYPVCTYIDGFPVTGETLV